MYGTNPAANYLDGNEGLAQLLFKNEKSLKDYSKELKKKSAGDVNLNISLDKEEQEFQEEYRLLETELNDLDSDFLSKRTGFYYRLNDGNPRILTDILEWKESYKRKKSQLFEKLNTLHTKITKKTTDLPEIREKKKLIQRFKLYIGINVV